MAVDNKINTGETLSRAERKLLDDPAVSGGLARLSGADDQKPAAKASAARPGQKTAAANTKGGAADALASDKDDRTQDQSLSQANTELDKTELRGDGNKPGAKAPGNPVAEFNTVRGVLPTALTPSVMQKPVVLNNGNNPGGEEREAKRRLKDISYIALGATESRIADTQASSEWRRDAESPNYDSSSSYSYGYSDDPYYESQMLWQQQQDSLNYYNDQMDYQLSSYGQRRNELQDRIDMRDQWIQEQEAVEPAMIQERDDLTQKIDQNRQDMDAADQQMNQAQANLSAKRQEESAKGAAPEDIATRQQNEEALSTAAWDKNRDGLVAEYAAKGVDKEFATIEKFNKTPDQVSPQEIADSISKIKQAGLNTNIDRAMVEHLQKTDPTNPYLKTVDAAQVGVQIAAGNGSTARETYVGLQNENAEGRVVILNENLTTLNTARSNSDLDKKEIRSIDNKVADLNKQKTELVAYQTYLKDNKTQIIEGKIPRAEFEAQTPSFLRDTMPQYAQQDQGKEAAISAQTVTAPAAGNTSRTATSASGPAIKTDSQVMTAFNNAAPDASPAPDAPAIERKVAAPALVVAYPGQ